MTDIIFDCWECGEQREAELMIVRVFSIEFRCKFCQKYTQTTFYPRNLTK